MELTHLAVFENGKKHETQVIDLTAMKAQLLASDTEYRAAWADAHTPEGYRFTLVIPKQSREVAPVALWRGNGV
jgi:hypothetical protein